MKKNALISLFSILTLWLIWVIAYFIVRNEYLLPSFWETFAEMGRQLISAAFWRAFWGTFSRTLISFLFSFLLGAACALLTSVVPWMRAFFDPIVSVLRTVPTMAVILVLLLWTNARIAPVIVTLLVLFPAFYAASRTALDEVELSYGEVAVSFHVPTGKKICKMLLPLAAPMVLSQAGSILSMGLKITVSGEVLSNTYKSLGGLMQEAKIFVQMPTLMALTLVVVLLGFALEGACALVFKLTSRWRA